MLLLLHGAVGNLDELLVCGGLLALALIVYLVGQMFVPKEPGEAEGAAGTREGAAAPAEPAPTQAEQAVADKHETH